MNIEEIAVDVAGRIVDSAVREWREKWWKAEVDRRKLEIDLAAKRIEDAESAEANRLKFVELNHKIDVLEEGKGEWEAENRKAKEKISELNLKIEVLEKEKVENREDIKRIVKEMRTANDMHFYKLISSHEERTDPVSDVGPTRHDPTQQVHLVSDVGPTRHDQGSPSVDASANEPNANSNNGLQSRRHDGRVLRSDTRRRKVENVGRSFANEAGSNKRCKSNGIEESELSWNGDDGGGEGEGEGEDQGNGGERINVSAKRRARLFIPANPYFVSRMCQSYLTGDFRLWVPAEHANEHKIGEDYDKIRLRVDGVRTWRVDVTREPPKHSRLTTVRLTTGWKRFALDNKLKVGDACVFELLIGDEAFVDPLYRVHIFRE